MKTPRQIKKWACHKLECFADYVDAYTRGITNTRCYYLELYAGCGRCVCSGADCCIDDSALRVLKAGFSKYIFVVKDPEDAQSLKRLTAADKNVEIVTDSLSREKGIRQLLDIIPRSASSFAFIDPVGYRGLRWSTVRKLAAHSNDWQGHKMDMLIIFPLEMALLRNLTRSGCEASITRLYGNHKWQEIRQRRLEGKAGLSEGRQQLIELFKAGLKGLGYKYVTDFKPPAFSRQPFYYVIWASDRGSGKKTLEDTWGKPRYLPCELLYTKEGAINRVDE